ncbi:uncharacterized protein CLUP02_03965 [Colletotrichum lupini]|uniref:Uncharacterized protein n=1 Tax=Colletotrichum lupini TaxID=145971 RepID=A0A9Q8WCA9_9PEZI|nr:uncharacterized protein CLUP02_03965 [Colletotrichum lupini]UQC78488.1 hypothetical protein CLUP02_03965 [Colletotrichum lupini]
MAPEYTVNVHSQPLHQSQTAYSASNTKPIDESTTETTSLTSNRAKPKKSKVATSEYSWTLEIWALVLSIAALVTATALLSARKNDYMIIYDRFEEAGRGPLGSARLLWHIKRRHWVSLGALATVVLLGFEPFVQAVVEFYEKEVDSSEVDAIASIGTTKKLDVGKAGFSGNTPLQSIQMPEPYTAVYVEPMFLEYDLGSLSAIWTGFNNLSIPSSQQPFFTCATRNCTWAPCASLAVCSACNDISSHFVKSTGIADASNKALTVPWSMQNARLNTSDKFSYTKFELPAMNLNISNFDDGSGQQVELTAQTTTQPRDTISFQDKKALIVSCAMMKAKMNAAGGKEKAPGAGALDAFVEKFARRSGSLALKQLVYPTFELLEPEQPSVISTLGTSQNLSSTFDIAALGMTKWMRDVSLQTAPHRGTTRESVVRIRVRWAFISPPFGALLCGCLFCLFSMLETRRLRLPA